jgi:hypothetical protein
MGMPQYKFGSYCFQKKIVCWEKGSLTVTFRTTTKKKKTQKTIYTYIHTLLLDTL